jgi:hypothetical protein
MIGLDQGRQARDGWLPSLWNFSTFHRTCGIITVASFMQKRIHGRWEKLPILINELMRSMQMATKTYYIRTTSGSSVHFDKWNNSQVKLSASGWYQSPWPGSNMIMIPWHIISFLVLNKLSYNQMEKDGLLPEKCRILRGLWPENINKIKIYLMIQDKFSALPY